MKQVKFEKYFISISFVTYSGDKVMLRQWNQGGYGVVEI
jgi:hypothetical protein